jgi:hypothetical protein
MPSLREIAGLFIHHRYISPLSLAPDSRRCLSSNIDLVGWSGNEERTTERVAGCWRAWRRSRRDGVESIGSERAGTRSRGTERRKRREGEGVVLSSTPFVRAGSGRVQAVDDKEVLKLTAQREEREWRPVFVVGSFFLPFSRTSLQRHRRKMHKKDVKSYIVQIASATQLPAMEFSPSPSSLLRLVVAVVLVVWVLRLHISGRGSVGSLFPRSCSAMSREGGRKVVRFEERRSGKEEKAESSGDGRETR